jgi:hypothetical protein
LEARKSNIRTLADSLVRAIFLVHTWCFFSSLDTGKGEERLKV